MRGNNLPVTKSGTTRDKQHKSFVESPTRGENFAAREVFVGNGAIDAIPVEVTTGGVGTLIYNEVSSVAGLATVTIIDYTVPVGKTLNLKSAQVSGENKAVFHVEVDASVIAKKRTYFTEYNSSFVFEDIVYTAGKNIKVIVENTRNSIADFNASLQGNLRDA